MGGVSHRLDRPRVGEFVLLVLLCPVFYLLSRHFLSVIILLREKKMANHNQRMFLRFVKLFIRTEIIQLIAGKKFVVLLWESQFSRVVLLFFAPLLLLSSSD